MLKRLRTKIATLWRFLIAQVSHVVEQNSGLAIHSPLISSKLSHIWHHVLAVVAKQGTQTFKDGARLVLRFFCAR